MQPHANILEGDFRHPPPPGALPASLLYAIAAPIGGHGLGTTSAESLRAAVRTGILGGVVASAVDRGILGSCPARDLSFHPARWVRWFGGAEAGMGARKQAVEAIAARWLRHGRFDCFHGWSGEALGAMLEAKKRAMPCLLDIPTWHRDKGRRKPFLTQSEREQPGSRHAISRQQILTEYALADLVLVQSRAAADSFLSAGISPHRLFLLGRGVDPDRFSPSQAPEDVFRLVFLGTLCRRKGVHHLLEAWKRLALPRSELVLVGGLDPDIGEALRSHGTSNVRVTGFAPRPQEWLGRASAFVLPSALEGAAKSVYEAAACGLPVIATRESGDVVEDRVNGLVIPPEDPVALAEAIRTLHAAPDLAAAMGRRSRERVLERYTWEHHRNRLLHAYAEAKRRSG